MELIESAQKIHDEQMSKILTCMTDISHAVTEILRARSSSFYWPSSRSPFQSPYSSAPGASHQGYSQMNRSDFYHSYPAHEPSSPSTPYSSAPEEYTQVHPSDLFRGYTGQEPSSNQPNEPTVPRASPVLDPRVSPIPPAAPMQYP